MILIKQIIRLGVSKDDKSLTALRQEIINAVYLIISFATVFLLIIRLSRGEFYLASINLGLLVLLGISFLFCYKKLHQIALLLMGHYLIAVAMLLHFKGLHVSVAMYLSLVPSVATFIFSRRTFRAYYFGLCSLMYVGLHWEDWNNIIPYIALSLCGFVICSLFNTNMERVHAELLASNAEKDATLEILKEKNEELVVYSNMMGHDLKAPILNIQGFSKILLKKVEHPVHKQYLQHIINSTTSLSALIEDLLMYSKINQTEIEKAMVDLNEIIEEQKLHFSYRIGNNKALIQVDKLHPIYGDSKSLKTVFHNLISNGLKYQYENTPSHLPTIQITSKALENKIIIYVKDNGIGIKEEYTSELFTPFRRFHSSKYKGTGLGMSICKRVMDKHEARITLDYTGKEGSCFMLEFPKFG